MSCSRDDSVLLPIPFTDLSSNKVRPAIVVSHGSFPGDLFVVPVTSQLGNADFVQENGPENIGAKSNLYREIDRWLDPAVVTGWTTQQFYSSAMFITPKVLTQLERLSLRMML